MGCISAVIDGVSYGICSGFVIGLAVGAVYAKIIRVPHVKPVAIQNGVANAVFGGTFFGVLMAYKNCFWVKIWLDH